MGSFDPRRVAEYYDRTLPFYRLFWHRDPVSHAVHYGFWDSGTKTLQEALLNENRFLARLAGVGSETRVLDAGCGIGGSSIWLAQNVGTHVVGISVSERQIARARQLAQETGVADKTEFYVQDFLNTGFPESSFDVAWAIESACHAVDKRAFLHEMHRVLRPGGRLVVADGFLRRPVEPVEEGTYRRFLDGLALPGLAQVEEFRQLIEHVGFRNVRFFDKTENIRPSSRRLFILSLLFSPFFRITYALGLVPAVVIGNGPAGLAQYKIFFKSGLAGYYVFYGEK